MGSMAGNGEADLELQNEPPLLEELGINPDAVLTRIKAVAFFKPLDQKLVLDGDLLGPALIVIALMMALLLQGKLHFETVYFLSVVSVLSSWLLINLMAQKGGIDM